MQLGEQRVAAGHSWVTGARGWTQVKGTPILSPEE